MFFLIIGCLFTSIQIYLFIKSRRFVREIIPGRWSKALQIFLCLFFLWMLTPILALIVFDRSFWGIRGWELYAFVYPFFTWMTASLMLVAIFITKDLLVLFWKGGKRVFLRFAVRNPSHNQAQLKKLSAVENPGRRKFLQLASAGLAVPPIALASYGVLFGSRTYNLIEIDLFFPNLPENLRGLRIVQFTDIHCSRYTPQEDVERAAKYINDQNADLVLLIGDYVPGDARFIHPCADAVANIRSKYGIYATLGNHEEWTDPILATKVLQKKGIPVFRNAGKTVTIRGEKLNLLGVDDSWVGNADLQKALTMVEPGNFNLLMSHQPPFWDVARNYGIDLTLSGHTHGGQVGLKLIGGTFRFGQVFHKYNQGLFTEGNSKLYVSTGFGFTGPPIRINIPPEIIVITLT